MEMGSLRNGTETPRDRANEEEEPILKEQNQRFCMFPIRYKPLWEMYKKAEASFWTGIYVNCVPFSCFYWKFLGCLCIFSIGHGLNSALCYGLLCYRRDFV